MNSATDHEALRLANAQSFAEENGTRLKRRLAVVCFADVVGWSSLVEANDAVAAARWESLRERLIRPLCVQFSGRILEIAGDAVVVEFTSVVASLDWAIALQAAVRAFGVALDERPLLLRISVGVDDCIVDGDKLVGDGVNVAARILQLASPGEIVTSDLVRTIAANKVSTGFVDLGEHQFKNIGRLVRAFRIEPSIAGSAPGIIQPHEIWHSRPTLAVLPFRSIGGKAADRYFAEGITEELVDGLGKSHSMFVVARSSTLRYAKNRPDTAVIAQQLGVRYILDGSVRRAGSQLRISAELLDTTSHRSLWSKRFDGTENDIFTFQDQIVSQIAPAIEPQIMNNETQRAMRHPTENLSAYDSMLRARAKMFTFSKADFDECGALLHRAETLDPSYAQVKAHLAWWYSLRLGEGWSSETDLDRNNALALAKAGVDADNHDPFCLAVWGHVLMFVAHRFDEAAEQFDTAVRIDGNAAFAWGVSSSTYCFLGRPEDALVRLKNAYRLSPFDRMNFFFWTVNGLAEFLIGRYEESVAWCRKALQENGRFLAAHRILTAALSMSGDEATAKQAGVDLMTLAPSFRVSEFTTWYPLRRKVDLERFADGLLRADIPN